MDELIEQIARDQLMIETLETRRSDSLDFHEVAVWNVKHALQLAFLAGKESTIKEIAAKVK